MEEAALHLARIERQVGDARQFKVGIQDAEDPVAQARLFASAGAQWIHVVDLDAARTGEPANLAVIERIASEVACAIEVGGGVRSRASPPMITAPSRVLA